MKMSRWSARKTYRLDQQSGSVCGSLSVVVSSDVRHARSRVLLRYVNGSKSRIERIRCLHRKPQQRKCVQQCLPSSSSSSSSSSSVNDNGELSDTWQQKRSEQVDFDVWSTKPVWCQPWTIILTGCILMALPSWLVSTLFTHRATYWPSILIALPVFAWWYIFLYLYPMEVSQYMNRSNGDTMMTSDDGSKHL